VRWRSSEADCRRARDKRQGCLWAKRGFLRFRSGHPQILGQEAAEMAGARTFVFVDAPPPTATGTLLKTELRQLPRASCSQRLSLRAPLTITARCRSSSRQVLPPQRAAPPRRTRPSHACSRGRPDIQARRVRPRPARRRQRSRRARAAGWPPARRRRGMASASDALPELDPRPAGIGPTLFHFSVA